MIKSVMYRFLLCAILLLIFSPRVMLGQSPRNYAHHPIYIYNFCRFTQWPVVKTELVIGVLGNSPLYQGLQRMAATKSTYNLKFVIKKYNTPAEMTACDVLFVPSNAKFDMQQVSQKLSGKNVMLITEDEKVAKQWSCFNFVVVEGKLMYQVNRQQCTKSNLKISQKLLSLGIPI